MSLLQMFTATPAAPFAWSLVLSGGSVVASIIPLGAARSAANFEIKDMAAPRAMFDRYPSWGKRASWAHQNSFEAFTLHAPAALLALLAVTQGADLPATAVVAAFTQPFLRLAYIAATSVTFHRHVDCAGPVDSCAPEFSTAKDSRP